MNNLELVKNIEGTLVVSSRQVAEDFGKEHNDTKKRIRELIRDMGEISHNYFILSEYKDSLNRTQEEYLLTRDGFSLLVMGFTGAKALEWKLKYIEAFNKMEQALREQEKPKLPNTYKEALLELVKTIEEKERVEEEKQRLIHNNKTYTATEMAKELGFRSAVAFNKYLAEKKIQYKVNNTWVLSARYSECGYQSIKQIELDTGIIVYDRRWTGLGRDWLVNEVMKEDKTVA